MTEFGHRATTAVILRPFVASDQDAVRNLILAGLGDHFGMIDPTKNPDLDDIQRSYIGNGGWVTVAVSNGEVVGTGTLIAEGEAEGRLVRMSVANAYRGLGIGTLLVRHLLEAARSRGYRRVVLETNDDWYDTIAFYQHCGFIVYGSADGDILLEVSLLSPHTD